MSIWAIIPVKPLNRAKSRLNTVLDPEARVQFAEAILKQMLKVVNECKQIAGTLVISRDPKVLSIARDYGAKTIQESGNPELNEALNRATQIVRAWKSEAMLILPADLPFITHDDIENLIALSTEDNSIVIATDEIRDGTNALLVRPPGLISYHYGEQSFEKHFQIAEQGWCKNRDL